MIPTRPTLAFALLAACAPAIAAASPIVVLNDGPDRDTIISRNGYYIHLFADEVTLDPYDPLQYPQPNTITIDFGYSLQLYGAISGNPLPDWPPLPVPTPALLAEGGLKIKDQFIDASSAFNEPQYDPTTGGTNIAQISHGAGSNFNLTEFTVPGQMAYVGYASSDFSIIGYLQIERVTEVDWKLVGYAFDTSGEGILVQNLVPAPGVMGVAGIMMVVGARRRR
ncbi:MAG: hypothetical protein KF838_11390 [Phycisphaeraceae bacterium]|nr:MAG: hypothetical protein KF838_11390 [Phycisphaeraceae bacterium]